MRNFELSHRLQDVYNEVASVSRGGTLADVGTDHGLLPIALVNDGHFERAVLTDVRSGPLEAAKKNVLKFAAEPERFETRLGSGFEILKPGEAGIISVCGMGGLLIASFIEKNPEVARAAEKLILEPNTCESKLRRYLWDRDFVITNEKGITEKGHPYIIMSAEHGKGRTENYNENDLVFGKFIIERRSPDDLEYLSVLKRKIIISLSGMESGKNFNRDCPEARYRELTGALDYLKGKTGELYEKL